MLTDLTTAATPERERGGSTFAPSSTGRLPGLASESRSPKSIPRPLAASPLLMAVSSSSCDRLPTPGEIDLVLYKLDHPIVGLGGLLPGLIVDSAELRSGRARRR